MVKVRFAPSPTGYLHIGSARSALFNWLFARHNNGKFILRIEDTDKERSKDEYLKEIMESLRWLGMDWDGEPSFQSKRAGLYRKAAERLLEEGKAYTDEGAIRFRMPEKKITVKDITHGDIEFGPDVMKDEVIIKSDGFPTYNFACVIDDADMGITHVIRGDDHISNTPKQVAFYEALGYPIPRFAHIPLILGPDGGRLSKRHGATSLREYSEMGYVADAVVNYLALLGWSPGDDREIMSADEIVKEFTLERVNKTSATFDIDKLTWMNGQYIKDAPGEKITELAIPFLKKDSIIGENFDREKLGNLVELYKIRARTLKDFAGHLEIFYKEGISFDEEAVAKHLKKSGTKELLGKWRTRLAEVRGFGFGKAALEEACRKFSEESGIKPGQVIHPTRVAISGRTVGAGLFEMMEIMGRETVLKRLDYAIGNLAV